MNHFIQICSFVSTLAIIVYVAELLGYKLFCGIREHIYTAGWISWLVLGIVHNNILQIIIASGLLWHYRKGDFIRFINSFKR